MTDEAWLDVLKAGCFSEDAFCKILGQVRFYLFSIALNDRFLLRQAALHLSSQF